jgi:hypothetical protein
MIMEFRTIVDPPGYPFRIGYEQQSLLIGSCFAGAMGERLARRKMPVTVNPFGVVYNPASIVRTLERLETGTPFDEEDLREHDGLWFSFSHHGSFASPNKNEALARINASVEAGHRALQQAETLIITQGTAWIYELAEGGGIVNNCHKLPASAFRRRRLSEKEITGCFVRLFERPLYRKKNILLTVSPIRHLKDGLIENQLSKATLLVAAHRLAEMFGHVHYFPAYEILMDDLRDYRFYERDRVHPSEEAVDYVWERFCSALVDPASQRLFRRVEKIRAACDHRPFHPDTARYRSFRNAMLAEIVELKGEFPKLDLSEELAYFSDGYEQG